MDAFTAIVSLDCDVESRGNCRDRRRHWTLPLWHLLGFLYGVRFEPILLFFATQYD